MAAVSPSTCTSWRETVDVRGNRMGFRNVRNPWITQSLNSELPSLARSPRSSRRNGATWTTDSEDPQMNGWRLKFPFQKTTSPPTALPPPPTFPFNDTAKQEPCLPKAATLRRERTPPSSLRTRRRTTWGTTTLRKVRERRPRSPGRLGGRGGRWEEGGRRREESSGEAPAEPRTQPRFPADACAPPSARICPHASERRRRRGRRGEERQRSESLDRVGAPPTSVNAPPHTHLSGVVTRTLSSLLASRFSTGNRRNCSKREARSEEVLHVEPRLRSEQKNSRRAGQEVRTTKERGTRKFVEVGGA